MVFYLKRILGRNSFFGFYLIGLFQEKGIGKCIRCIQGKLPCKNVGMKKLKKVEIWKNSCHIEKE